MIQVIGIRFKEIGKMYYFDPNSVHFKHGESAIVETSRGVECGKVVMGPKPISESNITTELKPIIRKANNEDLLKVEQNQIKEKEAFNLCAKKIAEHNIKMKLISAEYTFDNKKLLFYFTADGRVDFRNLVKDLAAVFKTRIELRQIGVRDESRILGGLGICGKAFCCSTFLNDFQPVSIKMAKEQGLSLNPVKISGSCGRLMCCLRYEQDAYTDLLNKTPKIGAIVNTSEGKGTVIDQNLLTGKLVVRMNKAPEAAPKIFKVKDVTTIKDGKIKIDKEEFEKLKDLE